MAEALAALILRLVVGGIMTAQGYRKLLADPSAPHGREQLTRVIAGLGFAAARPLALLVASFELLGGVLLLVGLFTRVAAVPLVVILAVAVRAKWPSGFFGGWDWPLSVLGATLALLAMGAGGWSLDAVLGLPLR
jgi:putative oxidoreductase